MADENHRPPTVLRVAGVVATLALLVAGCTGKSQSVRVASIGPSASTRTAGIAPPPTLADKVAASHCMRTHGVPNFPDPITINGKKYFGFSTSSGVKDTPAFQAAYKLCGTKYLGLGHRSTPAQRARWHAQAVRYTACMRAQGASDFPDPEKDNGAIDIPTSEYLNAPKVQRAQQACKAQLKPDVVFVVPW